MAKKYQVVMAIIHQASDDAYGKNILEKNHMYYSNVGVQGTNGCYDWDRNGCKL